MMAAEVEPMEVTMDEVRAYRRREVRRAKKLFQSRASDLDSGLEVVEAFLVLQRGGVENEEGGVD